jgi:hypothetical protein
MSKNFRLACTIGIGQALLACAGATAQPTEFFDLGVVTPPAAPATAREFVPLNTFDLFDVFEGDLLTVEWVRFEVQTPIVPPLYLDVDTRLYQLENLPVGLTLALYNASGNLVAVDDRDGTFPEGFGAAGLSFGSTAYRVPPDFYFSLGQDGTLQPGVYWLALSAGGQNMTTAGPAGWGVQTDAAYPIGFFDPGTYYIDISMVAGNTTPVPPPPNDLCEHALIVGENLDRETPVWTGSNAGAFSDGQFPCYRFNTPPFDTKDVWFRYVPSRTGAAIITAEGGSGGATPMIDRYDASQGCGSPSVQCVGGGSITTGEGTRMFLPVTQGEPILLALGLRAGYVDDMRLNINLVPDPCPLTIPPGAVSEREAACGEDLNGGCNVPSRPFDPIDIGQTVTGTLFTTPTLRDTDWFTFTVAERSSVTIRRSSQLPCFVVGWRRAADTESCYGETVIFEEDVGYFDLCEERAAEVALDAGEYVLATGAIFFDTFPCGTGREQYWIRVETEPLPGECPPCAADFNQDGGVDGLDLEGFFPAWADAGSCADVNLDGGVDGGDVEFFILLWEQGGC